MTTSFSLDVSAAIPKESIIVSVIIPGDPVTKARPRFFAGHAYTPKRTRAGEHALKTYFMAAYREKPTVEDVGISVVFRCAVRQRRDTDNMLKAVLDAATGVIWNDDSQVVEIHGRKIYDSEEPSTEVVVFAGVETRKRCRHCKEVLRARAARLREFCSQKCRVESTHRDFKCTECAKPFCIAPSRRQGKKVFCSLACAGKWHGRQKTLERGPHRWRCKLCGGFVSRPEYTRCAPCRIKTDKVDGRRWIVRPFKDGAQTSYVG